MSTSSAPLSAQQLFYLCQPQAILSLKCPAGQPPPGMTPLNPNGASMLPILIGVSVGSSILILLAMAVRLYTRSVVMKLFVLEDGLMMLSTISFFTFLGFLFSSTPYGLGHHTWDITITDLFAVLRRQYPAQIMWNFFVYPAKLSMILQIQRIFNHGHSRKQDFLFWASWIIIAFLTTYSLCNLFVCIFPCKPIRRMWDQTLPGTCMNPMVPGALGAIGNLVSDIFVLCLPIVGVSKLQMERKKKFGVTAIFGTGVLACIVACIRIHYTLQKETLNNDYMKWVLMEAMLAVAEGAAITLCCCFPIFPRFWHHLTTEQLPSWSTNSKVESYQLSRGADRVGHGSKGTSYPSKSVGSARYWDMGEGDDIKTAKGESEERIVGVIPA